MSQKQRVYPPERPVKKVLLSLPVDQVELIDRCASAVGFNRSPFLQIFIDTFSEHMVSFTEGMLAGTNYFRKLLEKRERVHEAKEMAQKLGTKLMESRKPQ